MNQTEGAPRPCPMIVLATDFGTEGPYVGQMKAVLHSDAPGIPIVDLFHDLPHYNPRAAAYLLAAYQAKFPPASVFLCVVDPGVGDARREAVTVFAGERWFVGPDNGLFDVLSRRLNGSRCWPIDWNPDHVSASFHGRDVFAPVAARLARGETPRGPPREVRPDRGWPEDAAEIVYIDRFGNAITGLRAGTLGAADLETDKGRPLRHARTFSAVPKGHAFWYENANGLIEIAVNQGCASDVLGLTIGQAIRVITH